MAFFRVKNYDRFQHYKDRSPPWIKLYNELLDDYDFGLLPDASKMHLVAIWLLASRSENKIPLDAKWVAGRINATEAVDLELLADRGFILLDQPLERVASNPIAECLSREEGQDQDIEKRKEDIPPVAKATRLASSKFDEFWREYPKRDGENPRKPAEKKFNALVKTGVDPDSIIAGARQSSADARARGAYGTKFIPQAIKWLNDQRFIDYAAAAFVEERPMTGFYARAESEQLEA